ncbi:hypothetical protein ACIHJG_02650 [Streptomyces sp. NPDC052415]|uniref:hypothetical protein n=1 Tax=Streptomyces sp. NPDC052415 TaxID=3365690 RepID=UPI0037D6B678
MATPIYDMDSVMLSSQVTGIEHVILSAVPEFIGALAATLVSSGGMWAFQKWCRQDRSEANEDDVPR